MTRDQLKIGDIILTSRPFQKDSRTSVFIKVGTLSRYSHAMVYFGNNIVVEAVADGVTDEHSVTEATTGCDLATVFRHAKATPEQLQRVVQFAKSKVGGAFAVAGVYGGAGILAFGLASLAVPLMINRSITNSITEALRGKRSYFCSELVADAYRNAGLPLGRYGNTPSLMNPGDIGEYSDRNPGILQNLGDLK